MKGFGTKSLNSESGWCEPEQAELIDFADQSKYIVSM